MRASLAFVASFVAAAMAQTASLSHRTASASTSSYAYTNPFTSYLTETNSLGVVTGMPEVATVQPDLPSGVTTQPAVATIPAGLSPGVTYLLLNVSRSLTSFEVSVGSSTTVVINGLPSGVSTTTGSSGAGLASGTATGTATGSSTSGSSGSSSSRSTTAASTGAAVVNGAFASAGLLGFGALFAALL